MNATNARIAKALMSTGSVSEINGLAGKLNTFTITNFNLTPDEHVFLELHEKHHAAVIALAKRENVQRAMWAISDAMGLNALGTEPLDVSMTAEDIYAHLLGTEVHRQ